MLHAWSNGTSVVFMWVPSYVGLADNSAVDSAAKAALLLSVSKLDCPSFGFKSLIRLQALEQWHLRWNSESEHKLHSIEQRVNVINMLRLPRRDEVKNCARGVLDAGPESGSGG